MRQQMHQNEIRTEPDLVRKLLTHQFPHWANLEIRYVESWGTDHDIYRLGGDLAVRLPRICWASGQVEKELKWLPKFAPRLSLDIPHTLELGQPEGDYPFPWSVCQWLPGRNASEHPPNLQQASVDLARFVRELRGIETVGAPVREEGARGGPLHEGDEQVRKSIQELGARIDAEMVTRIWTASLTAESWKGEEVWIHGDLLPGNLLVRDDKLSAVIDFGSLNVGDPACDLQPAWNLFDSTTRSIYRDELGTDNDSWMRGAGWVVYQTVLALPYYWETNAGIVKQAMGALDQVLADFAI